MISSPPKKDLLFNNQGQLSSGDPWIHFLRLPSNSSRKAPIICGHRPGSFADCEGEWKNTKLLGVTGHITQQAYLNMSWLMLVNLNIYLWPQRIHKLNKKGDWLPEKKNRCSRTCNAGHLPYFFPVWWKLGTRKWVQVVWWERHFELGTYYSCDDLRMRI